MGSEVVTLGPECIPQIPSCISLITYSASSMSTHFRDGPRYDLRYSSPSTSSYCKAFTLIFLAAQSPSGNVPSLRNFMIGVIHVSCTLSIAATSFVLREGEVRTSTLTSLARWSNATEASLLRASVSHPNQWRKHRDETKCEDCSRHHNAICDNNLIIQISFPNFK
ncbi:hypothetical protein HanPI659440_Chr05g0198811 [Helianthus annuus]|nr:hypothetical protein HanPI659440_Chr05g0198811 [Helianthus annuus]